MIGSAIYEKFLKFGYKNLIVRDRSELDLTDTFQTKKFFNENIIDFLILAAGYTGGILENKNQPKDLICKNLKIQMNVLSNAFEKKLKKQYFLLHLVCTQK